MFHSDTCINLFVDIEKNGKTYTKLFHHHPIVTMIYDLVKADLPRGSESTSKVRPMDYNVIPVIKIGGEIDDGTTATDVSIIKITPSITLLTKEDMASTIISTTKVLISKNSIL